MSRGRGMVFGLGKQTVNSFFENEDFEVILFSEFQNFGEANASPASPVPRPLLMIFQSALVQITQLNFQKPKFG